MMIAIVDYGSGNLRSAAKAFEKAASEVSIASRILVTDRAEEILQADYIVLPGVGSFGDCLAGLNSLHGVRAPMQEAVIVKGKPFMGICVGMQLMATKGTENGYHLGLDWIKGEVIALSKPEL